MLKRSEKAAEDPDQLVNRVTGGLVRLERRRRRQRRLKRFVILLLAVLVVAATLYAGWDWARHFSWRSLSEQLPWLPH